MRFSFVSAAILALAPSAFGQFFDSITSPTRDQVIPAGVPFDIIWAPAGVTDTIKITLLEGKTNITLNPGPIIATGVNNLDGKYTWTPTDAGFDTYGFLIEDEKNTTLTEYSQPFHIKGSGSTTSSIVGGSTTTIKLSQGPSYTSTSTSSVPSSTVTVVSTSTSANTTSSLPTPSPSSNLTHSSTLTTAPTTATTTSSTPSTTSGSTTSTTPNAAVAKMANGGLAVIGGVVLAFAL